MKKCDTELCTAIVKRKPLCYKCYDKKRNALPHRNENRQFHMCRPKYRESSRQSFYKYCRTIKGRFAAGKSASKRRNLLWDLTLEQYTSLSFDNCHYCNGNVSQTGSNLDRKDNKIGYTIANVVVCCRSCNELKGARFSYEEMVAVSRLTKELRSVY